MAVNIKHIKYIWYAMRVQFLTDCWLGAVARIIKNLANSCVAVLI